MRYNRFSPQLWSLLAAWALFWVALFAAWHGSAQNNNGRFVYVIDDAYITMAMAKNMALHGNWGPSPGAFASCASSPLWVLIQTAAFYLFGPREIIPLALNLLAGTGLVFLAWRILVRHGVSPLVNFFVLAALVLLTPMAPVACTGLEHLLHACIALAMLDAAARLLADGHAQRSRGLWTTLLVLTPLSTMVRYEQALMVGVIAVLFAAKRRYRAAAILIALAAAPIIISGAIFMAKGWMFLPTSIALKGNGTIWNSWARFHTFIMRGMVLLDLNPHFTVLLSVLAGLTLWVRRPLEKPAGVMTVIVLASGILHAQLASLGWFYRYEAYLVCMGLLSAFLLAREMPWQSLGYEGQWSQLRMAGAFFALLALGMPLVSRATTAHEHVAFAAKNIGEQQFQMALFLDRYYHGSPVAANDIGAIDFLADIDCLDLWGLSDVNIARLRMANHYDSAAMARIAHERGMKIAVVYDEWYTPYGGVPRTWIKAGEWTIPDNTICGDKTVSFYAVEPGEWESLHRRLIEFSRDLPEDVEFRICSK